MTLRARRGVPFSPPHCFGETSLERILEEVEALKPRALVVDSVQTVYSARLPSSPGSISQVREVATQLLFLAKGRGVTTAKGTGDLLAELQIAVPSHLDDAAREALQRFQELGPKENPRAEMMAKARG